ncbi:MAG TPA: EamA family transporter [Rhabdochlamydiaceae bacterium]|jgi:drug/metabolite transporter (DMT)-like permease
MKSKGYAMILAAAVCFASYGVWSRMLGKEFGVFYQGWVRSALVLAILFPFALIGKHFKPIKKSDRGWFALTMLFTVFTQAPLYFAFNHLTLGTATFLFYATFLITSYVIGWLFFSEKMTFIKGASLALSLIGMLLTCGLSLALFSLGAMLLAALNGIASGGEVVFSKKLTRHYSSLQVTFYSWILILATHLPVSLLCGERQVPPAWNVEWLAMLGYAISGIGGFWLIIEGFKHVDASIGGLIGILEIPMSALLGVALFADHMTLSVLIGGIIIVCAAVLPDIYALKNRRARPLPPPPPL